MRGYTAWDTLDPDAVVLRHERPHGTVTVYRRSSTFGTGSFRDCFVCVDRRAKSSFGGKQSKDEHDTSIRNFFLHDLGRECDSWKVNPQLSRKKSRKRLHSAPATTSSESLKIQSHIDTEALIQHSFREVCADKTRHLIYGKAEEREDPSAAQMKEAYESLLKREQVYVKDDLELFLEYNDMTEFRKKEILHKKWAEQVAEPIRREIDHQMHSRRLPALERRRQQLYDDYLTHVNKKGHVFLDIIAPDEYYALGLQDIQPYLLKAKTKRLRDPTLAQYRARNNEDRVELRCLSGSFLTDKDIEQIRLPPVPLVPLGREGVNATSWVRMPLADIDSTDRRASRRRMHSTGSRSAIDFGAWSRTPLTRAIVDEELQLQKKRHFPHPHAPQPQKHSHQPRPHPPTYEPRVNFQAGPSMVEPQPFGVEPQPSVVELQPSVVEPQPSVVEPQPSMVEPQPPMVEPQPPMVEPQLFMVEPQPHPSVVKPQPQMSVFEPQSHHYTHEPQPHTYPAMPGAIAPSNPYVIAC